MVVLWIIILPAMYVFCLRSPGGRMFPLNLWGVYHALKKKLLFIYLCVYLSVYLFMCLFFSFVFVDIMVSVVEN